MGQVLKERGPMFRKLRRPRFRPGQPRNTPNPPRHSAARPQQTGQIQSLGARPATGHPVITAFGLGLGKRILQDVRGAGTRRSTSQMPEILHLNLHRDFRSSILQILKALGSERPVQLL